MRERSGPPGQAMWRPRAVRPAKSPPSAETCRPLATTIGAAPSLIAWAEGKKDEGVQILRMAAGHEDAVDKHPVTPGALIPVREMLADLLLENGAAADALKEYEAVLKTAPRRFNATAAAAKAADKSGDRTKARAYAIELREIAKSAETSRPELEWARVYLGGK
jgi:hypothetical protein